MHRRWHLLSLAVGIVGTAIGVVGIVLAIIFATTHSCPSCPVCPVVVGTSTSVSTSTLSLTTTGIQTTTKVPTTVSASTTKVQTTTAVPTTTLSLTTTTNIPTTTTTDVITSIPTSTSTVPPTTTVTPSTSTIITTSTIPPTTTQLCKNHRAVFDGIVAVIFELSQASTQRNTILQFVESTLLSPDSFGLEVDGITRERHTRATTVPYPSTNSYDVQGYGSIQSLTDVRTQVGNFNKNIQAADGGGMSDALVYISDKLPAAGTSPAIIIVGNDPSQFDDTSILLANTLKDSFKIFTISIGENPGDFSPLSSGVGFSFTVSNGNDQSVADQIANHLEGQSPGTYCPPQ